MLSLRELVSRFPRWCVGVLIVPYMVGGEPVEYHVYPLKKSRKGIYYFSYSWEEIELPYLIKLFDLAPCILLKNGYILGIKKYSRKEGYGYIKSGGVIGVVKDSGEVDTPLL